MRSKLANFLAVFGLVVVLAGCGESQRPLGKVSGIVTFESKPIAEAVVLFQNKTDGVYMTAATDASGKYRVVMAEGAGLPLGTYQVAVQPQPPVPKTGYPLPPPPVRPDIPTKYRQIETSGLTLIVEKGANPFDIRLAP